jgi:acetolactate synthase-1/2/3 large subunit
VLVDICVDASLATMQDQPDLEMRLPGFRNRIPANMRQVKAAAEAINAAQRPVLYVGGGVISSDASDALRRVMEKGQIPVTTTMLGLGAVDENHPLALKMLGMHGSAGANFAIQGCDCLVALGARFDDRVTAKLEAFAPHAKVVHVDIDPASISKNVRVDVPVVGDARDILEKLLPLIECPDRSPWLTQIAAWRAKYAFRYEPSNGKIKPQQVVESLGRLTNHDAIIATGVGQHQMFTAQYYGWKRPRQIISSGGLGTMGFGVPAAIGAQFANPGATVIDIDGDGSFSMTMQEVITAVHYQQPVKFVVLDNGYLGMVRQWQQLFWGKRYSGVVNPRPDFAMVAQGFGAKGMRVSTPGELGDALNGMLHHEGPVVLCVDIEPEENVYPMVPVGKGLHEMEMGTLA